MHVPEPLLAQDPELQLLRPAEPLVYPLTVIGFVGGFFADEVCSALAYALDSCGPDIAIGAMMPRAHLVLDGKLFAAILAALALATAGAIATRMLNRNGNLFGVLLVTMSCCIVAGFVGAGLAPLGDFDNSWSFLLLMPAVGLTSAPFVGVAALLSQQAWLARPSTIAHRLFRRSMWLATASYVVVVAVRFAQLALSADGLGEGAPWYLLPNPNDYARNAVAVWVVAGASTLGLAVAVNCLVDFARLRRLQRSLATPADRSERGGAVEQHDLGVGQQEHQRTAPSIDPYRDTEQLVASCRGDFERVKRTLGWATAGASLLLLVSTLGLIFNEVSLNCY